MIHIEALNLNKVFAGENSVQAGSERLGIIGNPILGRYAAP